MGVPVSLYPVLEGLFYFVCLIEPLVLFFTHFFFSFFFLLFAMCHGDMVYFLNMFASVVWDMGGPGSSVYTAPNVSERD